MSAAEDISLDDSAASPLAWIKKNVLAELCNNMQSKTIDTVLKQARSELVTILSTVKQHLSHLHLNPHPSTYRVLQNLLGLTPVIPKLNPSLRDSGG